MHKNELISIKPHLITGGYMTSTRSTRDAGGLLVLVGVRA